VVGFGISDFEPLISASNVPVASIYLCIYSSFNDSVSDSDYIVLNNELKMLWKETVMA
jgi:hypothetical protein